MISQQNNNKMKLDNLNDKGGRRYQILLYKSADNRKAQTLARDFKLVYRSVLTCSD